MDGDYVRSSDSTLTSTTKSSDYEACSTYVDREQHSCVFFPRCDRDHHGRSLGLDQVGMIIGMGQTARFLSASNPFVSHLLFL